MSSSSSSTPAASPLRILYLDDSEPLRVILTDGLSQLGYEVEAAGDGLEGWQKFSRALFDLVITDLNMPNLDGIGFLQRVRESKRQVRIIVYSASLTEPNMDKLRDLAVDAAISKESNWIVLREIIFAVTRSAP